MSEVEQRLVSLERRLREVESELAELRGAGPATVPKPVFRTAPPPAARVVPPKPLGAPPLPVAATAPSPVSPAPARVRREREPFDLSRLLGARTLAVTGGIVSLLGIVFFFALAVQRGWIGPVARVSLGAAASGLALAAGWSLRRRFGETFAASAAAAVGVAGLYATLLAAAARYGLVPDAVALLLAALIAAAATAIALAWNDQLLAGLGLVGAILAPLAVAVRDDGLATTGVAFAVLMLAAAIVVSLRQGWGRLLVAATVGAGVQVAALLVDAEGREAAVLVVAIAFWALVLGSGVAESLRLGRVTRRSGSYVVVGSAFSGYAAAALYEHRALGLALLVSALANGALAAALLRRSRDLSSLLWATALALAAVGTAQLLDETTLTIAWAAEAAVLAWLAERLREPRFRLAALGWLALALVHAASVDAPLTRLFVESAHPASGVPSLVALGAAALFAARLPGWFGPESGTGVAATVVDAMVRLRRETRLVLDVLAGLLALDAASLVLLELVPDWGWAHVAVTGLWGAVAIGLLLAGQRLPGIVWAGATVALAVGYDVRFLTGDPRWAALGVAAATALFAALLFERELGPVSVTGAVSGAVLAASAGLGVAGHDLQWLLVLATGAAYVALGAAFLARRRDQSTLLWSTGLVLCVWASGALLEGSWLVVALSGAAAAAAVLARFEPRLDLAALSLLVLAAAALVGTAATLVDLFSAQRHPGAGVPAALALLAASAVYASLRTFRRTEVIWTASVVAVLAASLAILELSESLGGAVDGSFQRGHTAVSAFWGLIGLGLLYAGLVRRVAALQLAGFALFGISLAKLFLFDLAFLSSVARAVSFLAVGAVLIAGGFFYQRLAAGPEHRPPA